MRFTENKEIFQCEAHSALLANPNMPKTNPIHEQDDEK